MGLDPNNPGKKIEDYWEAGKTELLKDAKAFLNRSLKLFDVALPENLLSINLFIPLVFLNLIKIIFLIELSKR